MATLSVTNIFNLSKATLVKFGALDWVADAVADAIANSESVGNRICGFILFGELLSSTEIG